MQKLRRPVALLALVLVVTGCFDWKTVGALPSAADLPADTRITRYDGTAIVLAQARIENDTIKGYISGNNAKQVIPLAHVDLIEARQFQAKQSLIGGVLVGTALYLMIKGLQASQPFGPFPESP
jgi:hypothetical protein